MSAAPHNELYPLPTVRPPRPATFSIKAKPFDERRALWIAELEALLKRATDYRLKVKSRHGKMLFHAGHLEIQEAQ